MEMNIFKDCEVAMESELFEAKKRFVSESKVVENVPVHGKPEAVIFYVLEGSGQLSNDGETAEAVPAVMTHCPFEIKKIYSKLRR